MIPITKSWEWTDYGRSCRIGSANLCIFILGACQVISGVVAVTSLGFILVQLDMAFMLWNLTPKETK